MASNGTTKRAEPQFPISDALKAEMGVGQGAAKIDVWSVFSPMAGHVPKGALRSSAGPLLAERSSRLATLPVGFLLISARLHQPGSGLHECAVSSREPSTNRADWAPPDFALKGLTDTTEVRSTPGMQ